MKKLSYWPVRLVCHFLNMFLWISNRRASWIFGKRSFVIHIYNHRSYVGRYASYYRHLLLEGDITDRFRNEIKSWIKKG